MRKVARVRFGNIGEGLSPFPFALIYPQDEQERLLAARLAELGVTVERGTELTGLEVQPDRVVARLRRPGRGRRPRGRPRIACRTRRPCLPDAGLGRQKLVEIGGQPPDLSRLPAGCPFAPRCPERQAICLEQSPPTVSVGNGHLAECWVTKPVSSPGSP